MKFKTTYNRLTHLFSGPSREAIERSYLDQSVSMADLERRQREIQRGKFNRF